MTLLRKISITSPNTAFGDLRVAELSPIFQYSYEYTVDNTELNANAVTNGGTITQANGFAVMGTSTTTNSTACLQTRRQAKYKSGFGGLGRFTTLYETAGLADTEQYFGFVDELGSTAAFKNGYAIGFDGATFGYHRFQNDVKISTALSSWDDPLDGTGPSGVTIDHTKLNVWFIDFQYLGGGGIAVFHEGDKSREPNLVHVEKYSNLNTAPSVYMPNFRFMAWVNNKATTTDLVIKISSVAYFIEGKTDPILTHQPQQSTGIQQKTTVTTEVAIMTIRNKSTYASKTNYIEIWLEEMGASIEASSANNLGQVRLVRNATLGGSPSYSDINASDSVVDMDTAGTTVTGGKELVAFPLAGKNDRENQSLIDYKFIIAPGETVTVAGLSANSATINASLLWKELF